MKFSSQIMKPLGLVTLAVFIIGGAAADQKVEYELNFESEAPEEVELLLYQCETEDCKESGISDFPGSIENRYIQNPSEGDSITVTYPDGEGSNYGSYFFAEGYIPNAYREPFDGEGQDWTGEDAYTVSFTKHNTSEGALVQDLSAENMVYKDRALSVDVPANISGTVESPLDANNRAVDYLPRGESDEFYNYTINVEDGYRADTEINLDVNRSGSNIYSDQEFRSIYMDESQDFSFEWLPTQEGQHEIEVWTKVVDPMFLTEPVESSSLTLLINDWAYQALLDGLSVDTASEERHVGNTINFSVDYRSYFDQNIEVSDGGQIVDETDPVKTNFTYEVVDENGNVVDEKTEVLSAVETKTRHEFSWKPSEAGDYDINTRADPIKDNESFNASFAEASIEGLTIDEQPVYNVTFDVDDDSGNAISDASIDFNSQSYQTDSSGLKTIEEVIEGTYDYTVNHPDYESSSGSVKVDDETTGAGSTELVVNVVLQESPTAPEVNLPDQEEVFVGRTNTLGLDQYVDDDQVSDEEINWSVEGNSNLDIFIDSTRTANIDPGNWTGTEEVTFIAEDTVNNLEEQDTMDMASIENEPPQIDSIGDLELLHFESVDEHVYIPDVVSDDKTSYSNLSISLNHSFSNECGAEIVSDSISIDPSVNYSTSCDVELVVEDEYGFQSTEQFNVNVLDPQVEIIKSELVDDTVSAYSTYQGELIDIHSSIETQDTNFTVENGPEGLEIKDNGELYWDYPISEDANQTYNFTVRIVHDLQNEYPEEGDWEDTENYSLTVEDADESSVPSADLEVNQTEGFEPLTVEFTGAKSSLEDGEITNYKWDFGEGTTVEDQEVEENLENVTFTYDEPGTYTATLTVVSDKGLEDTASTTINVTEMPDEIDQIGLNSSSFTPDQPIYGDRINLTVTLDYDVNLVQRNAEIFVQETGENVLNKTQMNKSGKNLSVENISFDSQVAEAFEQGYAQATVVGEINLEDNISNIARAQEEFTINSPDMEILEPQVQASEAEFRAQIHSIGDFPQLTPVFEYRETGSENWSTKGLEPVTSGGQLSEPITLEENTEYEYRLVLSINPTFTTETRQFQTSSSGDSGGGSGGGSSGGGGGSFGGGFTLDDEDDETSDSKVEVIDSELDLDLAEGSTETRNITVNLTEAANLSLSSSGNVSEIISFNETFRGVEGVNQIPITLNASEVGYYQGNLTISWDNQSVDIPLTLNVDQVQSFDGELDIAILASDAGMSTNDPEYTVKIWDRDSPEKFEDVTLRTRIEDSEGQLVYENVNEARLGDVLVRDYSPGRLSNGEYDVYADIEVGGEEFTGVKSIEVSKGGSLTGAFTRDTSIGFLQGIWNKLISLLP